MMERPIINTYDQLKAAGGGIAIAYSAQDLGRGGRCAKWYVLRVSAEGKILVTNPKVHWEDRGAKVFLIFQPSKEKQAKLAEAMQWVEEKYGPREWVRNKLGDYVEAKTNREYPITRRKRGQ